MSYNVIYADPPWRYNCSAVWENDNIENHYQTMDLPQIKDLFENNKIPVAKNAVLWLWSPAPKLVEALSVMEAWQFKYITSCVWDKKSPGLGHWFRQQHELLLVGRRGDFHRPDRYDTISSVLYCARGQHSEKPFFIRDYLTKIYPKEAGFSKIELFARVNGELFRREWEKEWDFWGNES